MRLAGAALLGGDLAAQRLRWHADARGQDSLNPCPGIGRQDRNPRPAALPYNDPMEGYPANGWSMKPVTDFRICGCSGSWPASAWSRPGQQVRHLHVAVQRRHAARGGDGARHFALVTRVNGMNSAARAVCHARAEAGARHLRHRRVATAARPGRKWPARHAAHDQRHATALSSTAARCSAGAAGTATARTSICCSRVVSLLAAVGIAYWSTRPAARSDRLLCAALGLILAGTMGNLYDRRRVLRRARLPALVSLVRLAGLQYRRLLPGLRGGTAAGPCILHGRAARRKSTSLPCRPQWNRRQRTWQTRHLKPRR